LTAETPTAARHISLGAAGERGAALGPRGSRLEVVRREIDRVFGDGHAAAHPERVVEVMNAASSDWAATRLAVASEGQGYAVDGSAAAALEEKT
jgi:hypothetical protein